MQCFDAELKVVMTEVKSGKFKITKLILKIPVRFL